MRSVYSSLLLLDLLGFKPHFPTLLVILNLTLVPLESLLPTRFAILLKLAPRIDLMVEGYEFLVLEFTLHQVAKFLHLVVKPHHFTIVIIRALIIKSALK